MYGCSSRWICGFCTVAVGALLTAALVSSVAGSSFQGVGYLAGAPELYSVANGVSRDGLVAVGASNSASGYQAFRWTEAGGIVGLGYLSGYTRSEAYAASGDGSVVVGSSEATSPPPRQAFRWTSATGMVGLGWLPGGEGDRSWAKDVSSDGSVVVGISYRENVVVNPEAFRWTEAGGMIGLGFLPDAFASYGVGVTANGLIVVGGSWYGGTSWEATRWTWGGPMLGLGYLAGGDSSIAIDVSDNGDAVVGQANSASYPGHGEAFRWTAGTGMVGLGALPGATESYALAVSANGSIVVGSGVPSQAFYWSDGTGMVNLRDLLVNTYGLDLTGWTLGSATGISADGTTIVGTGTFEGKTQGWVAKIERVQVTVVKPNGGEVFWAGTQDTIRWIATEEGGGLIKGNLSITSVDISYSTDGGTTFPYTVATGTPNDGTYIWTIPGTLSNNCKVKVIAYSAELRGSDVSDNTFTIAAVPAVPALSLPGVVALLLAIGAVTVILMRRKLGTKVA